MANGTCSVEGCERVLDSRGWCDYHYRHWLKHGDPLMVKKRGPKPKPRPTCSVGGCERVVHGRGYCPLHYQQWKNNGDPLINRRNLRGPASYVWRGDDVKYFAVHRRLRVLRGSAKKFTCAHCGLLPARHWAYDHQDPNERHSEDGWPFSLDPERYTPLCSSCHALLDRKTKA